jgi:hypothetical protein
MATTNTNVVSLSRDTIRTDIITRLKTYLELEGVDLTKTSFLSFIVDTLATLTSNLLFYEVSVFREFFMTTAQTTDSIFNLATFLGYNVQFAENATTDVLIYIPLTFDTDITTSFNIPEKHKFSAGDIQFSTYYLTHIEIVNNTSANVYTNINNVKYDVPFEVVTIDNVSTLSFLLPVKQYRTDTYEFQIETDYDRYQFIEKEITFTGNITHITDNIEVWVTEPIKDASAELYNTSDPDTDITYTSLYLLSPDEKAVVVKRNESGVTIFFGNDLMGYRPITGSKVEVIVQITEGSQGNVIAGSITSGDRIYWTNPVTHINELVKYSVINPYSASGGTDGETTEEVRKNAIASITSLKRLVSGDDYSHIKTIVPELPFPTTDIIGGNIIPVLKRSDFQTNEIQIYTPLVFAYRDQNDDGIYDTEVVRTRCIYGEWTNNEIIAMDNMFAASLATSESSPNEMNFVEGDFTSGYQLMFDMTFDTLNLSASYSYTLTSISAVPTLISRNTDSTATPYNISISGLDLYTSVVGEIKYLTIDLNYYSAENTCGSCTCVVGRQDSESTITYPSGDTTNIAPSEIPGYGTFRTVKQLSSIGTGNVKFTFNIYNPSTLFMFEYSYSAVIRQDLNNFMKSNMTYNHDTSSYTVYDIPVIPTSYYDDITDWVATYDSTSRNVLDEFEKAVIQPLVSNMPLLSQRMLTDFVNLKFTTTVGKLTNILFNKAPYEYQNIISNGLTSLPDDPVEPERYIVNGTEGFINWATGQSCKKDSIVKFIGYDGTTQKWEETSPTLDTIIRINGGIEGEEGTMYIYSSNGWINPDFNIPFEIEVEVVKEPLYQGTDSVLSDAIKDALIDALTPYFGNDFEIYTSQITEIVQNIEGVSRCRVIKPECNIFFNFELKDLSHDQLLKYNPQYVYTDSDNITVRTVTR